MPPVFLVWVRDGAARHSALPTLVITSCFSFAWLFLQATGDFVDEKWKLRCGVRENSVKYTSCAKVGVSDH